MSRSGTLQDALRFVDEFHRAAAPAPRRAEVNGNGDGRDGHRKEKSSKDKKGKHERKRRRKSLVRDEEEDGNSDEDPNEVETRAERKERRAKRKKERKRKKEKEREKEKKIGRDSSSSRREEKKMAKEKERERKRENERRRKKRSERKGPPESDTSSSSQSEDDHSGSESPESGGGESVREPDQVAADIRKEFPEVEGDLRQLLERVDSGEAVDVRGIPSKRLTALLRELFRCLGLKQSSAGAYLLPRGARPTLERLNGILQSEEGPKSRKTQEESTPGGPLVSPAGDEMGGTVECGPSVMPVEQTQRRRVMGPAMPSAEVLEAAAKLTAAEQAVRDTEAELENDPMVGPPPPALVAEASSANDAERFEEVGRITAPDVGDAYDLLGLKRSVNPADLKKRYWKLSLLVHPDKCPHPQAQQAFMALNKAFKDLQDPGKKAEIDRKAEERVAREEFEADRRARREAAQWRKIRGEEPHPDDAEILRGDEQGPVRDEWMRVLPPERKVGGPPSQQNTFFSRTEKTGRGDTSGWTDTPLEKAQKAKMQYLEAYQQAALADRPVAEMDNLFKTEQAAKTAALIDQHDQRKRSVSLVEEHRQKRAREATTTKRAKKSGQVREETRTDWAESHPWKPWDREKDLAAGRLQSTQFENKKETKQALSSRFGTGGERNFL